MTKVPVIPDERTTWRVDDTGAPVPVSEHTNAAEAERAARARAEDRDAQRLVIHRTHDAARTPAGAAARERLKRTRRLARVRERARELTRATR